jgi:predicted DNA-binding protein
MDHDHGFRFAHDRLDAYRVACEALVLGERLDTLAAPRGRPIARRIVNRIERVIEEGPLT